MKVLIAVTHLLGTGHLSRALTLGRAFADAGHDVRIASGGMPAPHLDHSGTTLLQLPPLRSDGTNFTLLLDGNGEPATDDYLASRRNALKSALDDPPDILICELFPFGRRILSDEFLTLLDAAQALPRPPVILSSIRDILAPPSKPAKAIRADQIITRYFDAVLVHSDPHSTTLDQSWPVSAGLAAKLRYTGYVAPARAEPHPDQAGQAEVLVSAGGGQVGAPIFRAAMAAAGQMPGHQWRLLVGGSDPQARIDALNQRFPDSPAIVEPARRDFRSMLHHAAASVSMCGYNTALDLLQTGTPAVLIPFDDGKEVEQTLRARSLSALPGMRVLPGTTLNPQTLCAALTQVLTDPVRHTDDLQFDGAARSVALACNMACDMAKARA